MMRSPLSRIIGRTLATLALLACTGSAHGRTLYVATTGLDSAACGAKTSACRSIGQAVNALAADGDTIVVGPGRYGDLDGSGTLGDSPGEETGGFGCVLLIGRAVTLLSSDGAAATVIDGRNLQMDCNVGMPVDATQLGKPGKGFTVTNTYSQDSTAIIATAADLAIRGNQLVPTGYNPQGPGLGIQITDTAQGTVVEANQLTGFATAIYVLGANATVTQNQISQSGYGILLANSGTVRGNVITGCYQGIHIVDSGPATVTGNSIYGNQDAIFISDPFLATITKNNIAGSNLCGVRNGDKYSAGKVGAVVANNYWGAATGPGPDPADTVEAPSCTYFNSTTTATPFATKPFKVKAPIRP
ncbi:MAG TPA: NosD domain-containing protein [Candidatus Binatia bacterium]|jgi:parallel beta-helix repeat protein